MNVSLIADEECYKNWLMWGFWMEKLLQVNLLKLNGQQQGMDNSGVSTIDQFSGVEDVISFVVKNVVSQIKESGFQFGENGFNYFLLKNQVKNDYFDMIYNTNEKDECYRMINSSIQAAVIDGFINGKSKVTSCKRVDDSDVNNHDETTHIRSFSRFFYLTIDGDKKKIEFCLYMKAFGGEKGIGCRAIAAGNNFTSVCIVS